MSEAMSCRELVEFLADYLDQSLEENLKRAFEDHLRGCRSCTVYLSSYRDTIRMVRLARDDTRLTKALPEDLIQAILRTMKHR